MVADIVDWIVLKIEIVFEEVDENKMNKNSVICE